MPKPLPEALAAVRELLLDQEHLVRAVAAGRRRGARPALARAEIRPVDLRTGRRLQIIATPHPVADPSASAAAPTPTTRNHGPESAVSAVEELLAEPFGNWHIETTKQTVQLRVTKRGDAQLHHGPPVRAAGDVTPHATHDRAARHLLAPDDPLFRAIGADHAKRRQVDAFLRQLEPAISRLVAERTPTPSEPIRIVDLGCGNAYLTLAAHRYLNTRFPGAVRVLGIDIRLDVVTRNRALAEELSADGVEFVAAAITDDLPTQPDVVLALHACDTATDDALAAAVRSRARVVLAAPCCHHDLQSQIEKHPAPQPYTAVTRHPILRERFTDVLTDALRADILRMVGYRVSVVEFVASQHTARNVMIRAEFTAAAPTPEHRRELNDLMAQWRVQPRLWDLLADLLTEPAPPSRTST